MGSEGKGDVFRWAALGSPCSSPSGPKGLWGHKQAAPARQHYQHEGKKQRSLLGRVDLTTTITPLTAKASTCLSVWLRPFIYLWRRDPDNLSPLQIASLHQFGETKCSAKSSSSGWGDFPALDGAWRVQTMRVLQVPPLWLPGCNCPISTPRRSPRCCTMTPGDAQAMTPAPKPCLASTGLANLWGHSRAGT